jgi:hypothetical protein
MTIREKVGLYMFQIIASIVISLAVIGSGLFWLDATGLWSRAWTVPTTTPTSTPTATPTATDTAAATVTLVPPTPTRPAPTSTVVPLSRIVLPTPVFGGNFAALALPAGTALVVGCASDGYCDPLAG